MSTIEGSELDIDRLKLAWTTNGKRDYLTGVFVMQYTIARRN